MTILILILLGLCAGSFINALVWRLHEQLDLQDKLAKARSKKPKNKSQISKLEDKLARLSILNGHSMCPSCGHRLGFWDLIPVISWLSLRGKCRYCSKSISVQYPLIEVSTALLFVLIYLRAPFHLQGLSLQTGIFVLWLIFTVVLVALLLYDLKWMLFPDILLYVAVGIAALIAVLTVADKSMVLSWWSPLLGAAIAGGFLLSIHVVSKGKWMGIGDVPLAIAVGLALGWKLGLLALIGSFYVGTVIVLPALVSKKTKSTSKVPYGPFLIISTYIALFWGTQLIDWYIHTISNV